MNHQRMPPRFRDCEDEVLLSRVCRYPALYDWRHEDFKNTKVKSDIWESIAVTVGRDVETCKRRWKDIKDNYFKIKRQQKMSKCRWSLVGKLVFLDNVEPERRMIMYHEGEDREAGPSRDNRYDKGRFLLPAPEILMSAQEERDGQETGQNVAEDTTTRKRRFEESSADESQTPKELDEQGSYGQEDDVDLFMRSIAVQVKRFPPWLIAQAKVKILSTVNELQFGEIRVGIKKDPQPDD